MSEPLSSNLTSAGRRLPWDILAEDAEKVKKRLVEFINDAKLRFFGWH